jgi:hypothetical protein
MANMHAHRLARKFCALEEKYLLKRLAFELSARDLLVHVGGVGHMVLAVVEIQRVLHKQQSHTACTGTIFIEGSGHVCLEAKMSAICLCKLVLSSMSTLVQGTRKATNSSSKEKSVVIDVSSQQGHHERAMV